MPVMTLKLAMVVGLAVALLAGCASPKPPTPRPPETKPWLDGRNLCALALNGQPTPAAPAALREALEAGVRRSFTFPSTRPAVTLQCSELPHVDLLRVTLTGAALQPDRRPPKVGFAAQAPTVLRVKQFEMIGDPITMGSGKVTLRVAASEARFEQHRYKDGNEPALVMAEARHGTIHMSVSKADMEAMLLAGAKKASSVVSVKHIGVKLDTQDDGRDLRWQLDIDTTVMLLPAQLHITGRAALDTTTSMVTLSDMACDGDKVLGPLMASIVRPALARHNGRTKPLLSFGPTSPVRLLDAHVTGGERLQLDATFGAAPSAR